MSAASVAYLRSAVAYASLEGPTLAGNTMLLTSIVSVLNIDELWHSDKLAADVEVVSSLVNMVVRTDKMSEVLTHLAAVKVANKVAALL